MKTKLIISLVLILFAFNSKAQVQKGTWSIGGSGYRIKMINNGDPIRNIYEYNAESSYFIFQNFSAGFELTYKGGKDTDSSFDNKYHGLFFSPTTELYFLKKGKFTCSFKGLVQLNISGTGVFHNDKIIQSYSLGPKFSYFFTDNVSFYTLVAFRKILDDSSNYPGWTAIIPSENYDIRFGFNIFLKKRE